MGLTHALIGDAGIESDPKMELPEINDQGGRGHTEIPKSPKAIRIIPNLVFGNRQVEASALRMNFADGSVRPGTAR
jgi:hypothetical protein